MLTAALPSSPARGAAGAATAACAYGGDVKDVGNTVARRQGCADANAGLAPAELRAEQFRGAALHLPTSLPAHPAFRAACASCCSSRHAWQPFLPSPLLPWRHPCCDAAGLVTWRYILWTLTALLWAEPAVRYALQQSLCTARCQPDRRCVWTSCATTHSEWGDWPRAVNVCHFRMDEEGAYNVRKAFIRAVRCKRGVTMCFSCSNFEAAQLNISDLPLLDCRCSWRL